MKKLKRADFERWGAIGGKTRAKNLTPERRSEIARIAGSTPKRKKRDPANR